MAQVEVERLGVRYARRRRTSEVDDLSRKQNSDTQVFTGKRRPEAQSEVAEFHDACRSRMLGRRWQGIEWIHGRKKEGRLEGEEYQEDVVEGTLKKERSTLPSLGSG
jgi:hypothetical protein